MSPRRRPLPVLLAAATTLALAAGVSPAHAKTTWLCNPSLKADPCRGSLATTVKTAGGKSTVLTPKRERSRPLDCFYVYPTVSSQSGVNADLTIDPEQRAIAGQQASRFSQVCRMYAPVYRQLTLQGIGKPDGVQASAVRRAFGDVEAAWKDYLAHDNKGRPFVLIGHSQGSGMLTQLIRTQIDNKASVRARMVSAITPGGNVLVPDGKDVGGSFTHVPACRAATQTGCVVAYSMFDATPPSDAVFGRTSGRFTSVFGGPTGSGYHVLCTNPAALGGGTGTLTTYAQTAAFPGALGALLNAMYGGAQNAPTAPTAWVEPAERYRARCSTAGGADVLRVSPVGDAPVLTPEPAPTWGLHLVDVNLALGNLIDLVRTQSTAWYRAR